MPTSFTRNRVTILLYFLLGFYGYFLNVLGPIIPFLKSEFNLSYTLTSMHSTAIGLGIVCMGLVGNLVIQRIGQWNAIWVGAFSLSLGALLLVTGTTPLVTILATFLIGFLGSLILAVVPSILSAQYGPLLAVAYSEANFIASAVVTTAPLLVAWFASRDGLPLGGWRMALVVVMVVPFLLRLGIGKLQLPSQTAAPAHDLPGSSASKGAALPAKYWLYWSAMVLSVAAEFCMIYWSADYLEKNLGLSKAISALSVSLFLGGMILGRWVVSRLVQRFGSQKVILASLILAAIGFFIFWGTGLAALVLAGLFLAGLGVAGLYPLILPLALEAGRRDTNRASARATLASGVAILSLPLVLARLADLLGIRLAYSLEILLLVGVFLIVASDRSARPTTAPDAR